MLFNLVLEALSREFRTGVLWEILYADHPVLIADTQEECISKLKVWKAGMESNRLCVNMKKTKLLVSMVTKHGNQITLNCNSSTAMTMP